MKAVKVENKRWHWSISHH